MQGATYLSDERGTYRTLWIACVLPALITTTAAATAATTTAAAAVVAATIHSVVSLCSIHLYVQN
jgi:hypothetical protein